MQTSRRKASLQACGDNMHSRLAGMQRHHCSRTCAKMCFGDSCVCVSGIVDAEMSTAANRACSWVIKLYGSRWHDMVFLAWNEHDLTNICALH